MVGINPKKAQRGKLLWKRAQQVSLQVSRMRVGLTGLREEKKCCTNMGVLNHPGAPLRWLNIQWCFLYSLWRPDLPCVGRGQYG